MKKVTLIVLAFFVFSAAIPLTVYSKETTPVKVKKDEKKSEDAIVDPTVYIKENGKKFHKKKCKLVTEKTGIKLSEAKKKGYEPCESCFKSPLVYITETGKKFHKKDCQLVTEGKPIQRKLAKLEGYTPCKTCLPPPPPKKVEKEKK